MGLLTGVVVSLAGFLGFAPLVCAWAGAAFYFVTGWALHLDGWGDVWDGIGSGRTGDRLREVMKDSRLGSFGGASLVIAFAVVRGRGQQARGLRHGCRRGALC